MTPRAAPTPAPTPPRLRQPHEPPWSEAPAPTDVPPVPLRQKGGKIKEAKKQGGAAKAEAKTLRAAAAADGGGTRPKMINAPLTIAPPVSASAALARTAGQERSRADRRGASAPITSPAWLMPRSDPAVDEAMRSFLRARWIEACAWHGLG